METGIKQVTASLQSDYDEQYSDDATEWRNLGAKAKAKNIMQVSKGRTFKRVLECGAGEGSVLQRLEDLKAFQELCALEISDSGIYQIRKRHLKTLSEVKKFDGYHIPYPDNCFDMVYCTHVLEHVEHPRLLLRELRRIAPMQVFEVPLDYHVGIHKRVDHFLGYGHINIFTPSLFKFLILSEGFEILKERRTHPSDELLRYVWYNNEKKQSTFRSEASLKLRPWRERLRRFWIGKHNYNEIAYNAYTCLTQNGNQGNDGALRLQISRPTAQG